MRIAIDESLLSLPHDVPVGAIIVDMESGKIISRAHNERELNKNPLKHSEITAIEDACIKAGDWRLNNFAIFTTLEPCIMCAGTLMQSRIGAVVFGAYDTQFGAARSIYNFFEDPRLNHNAPVIGGVLESDCKKILDSFFAARRSTK